MSSRRGNEYSGATWDVQYACSTDLGGELPCRIRSRLCDARAALAQTSRALSDVRTLYVLITHTPVRSNRRAPGRLDSASISVNRQDT